MKKVIKLFLDGENGCEDCYHLQNKVFGSRGVCPLKDIFVEYDKIPDECPLEDAE